MGRSVTIRPLPLIPYYILHLLILYYILHLLILYYIFHHLIMYYILHHPGHSSWAREPTV